MSVKEMIKIEKFIRSKEIDLLCKTKTRYFKNLNFIKNCLITVSSGKQLNLTLVIKF